MESTQDTTSAAGKSRAVKDTGKKTRQRSDSQSDAGRNSRSGSDSKRSGPKRSNSPTPDASQPSRPEAEISLRSLLEAGVHFGHQTSRWNPAMGPYIYTVRNGIHIINLPKTVQAWEKARKAIVDVVSRGGSVLFVGTKKQAQDPVVEEAKRCGAHYVSRRWLGGMMTNFQTIRNSIDRMKKIETTIAEEEAAIAAGQPHRFTKKERLMMSRELEKLDYSLGGIKEMNTPPELLFVIDIKREEIAIKEAHRLDIPVVALVDTNCDPTEVGYPIPSNDDGTRAVRLFCAAISDAVLEGRRIHGERARDVSTGEELSAQKVRGDVSSAASETFGVAATEKPSEKVEKDDTNVVAGSQTGAPEA